MEDIYKIVYIGSGLDPSLCGCVHFYLGFVFRMVCIDIDT